METWLKAELQQVYGTPVFSSSDPGEAKRETVKAFKEHELHWARGKVDSALFGATLGSLSFFILRFGAAVHIKPGELEGFMLFQVPLAGSADIHVGNKTVAASSKMGAMISPTMDLSLDWSEGCEQMLVKIPRARVENTCRTLIGNSLNRGPIEFQPEMPMDGAVGRGWQYQLGSVLCNQLVARECHSAPLIHAQEETLIHHMLLCQPSNYSDHLLRLPPALPQRKLRFAEDYIAQHLQDPLTLDAIASACGIGVRSLCVAFRDHYQCSPMAYVRQKRLDAARAELLHALPGEQVTDIALRCGFTHLGRFSLSYRERFGEAPLQTLKR